MGLALLKGQEVGNDCPGHCEGGARTLSWGVKKVSGELVLSARPIEIIYEVVSLNKNSLRVEH